MFRLRSVFTGVAGSPWYVNTHHEGSISTEAQAAAEAMRQFWDTIKGNLEGGVVMQIDPTAVVIDPTTGTQTGQLPVNTVQVTMTGGGTPLPHANQILVRFTTGSYEGGRQIKGRMFIPGPISATAVAGGLLNPNTFNAVTTAANDLLTDSLLGIYSKKNGSFTRAQNATVWNQFATMRSRRD